MPVKNIDFLSYKGALILANRIALYWGDRGHVVLAEPYELPGGGAYGVRSGLINGLPRT